MIYIGIDTSNYTTSVAVLDGDKVYSERCILEVKQGNRGIRQSEGVFQHMKLLPEIFEKISSVTDIRHASAIGVSNKPRNAEDSYMPVFLAGYGYARVISSSLGIPIAEFSHQDGHIMAGVFSSNSFVLDNKEFLSVHLSGGTTEILKSRYNGRSFENEIIGGTKDISAGQYIDRVGVKTGMSFPAGKHMETAAAKTEAYEKLTVYTNGTYMSFSGAETKASRMAEQCNVNELARGVLMSTAYALVKTINYALKKYNIDRVLMVGGVASDLIIRKILTDNVKGKIFFASCEYSTDNAVGIALLMKKFAESNYGTESRNSITD